MPKLQPGKGVSGASAQTYFRKSSSSEGQEAQL